MTERFLKRKQVEELVGLGKSAIYAEMKNGRFPKPYRIGRQAVAWKESDIAEWQRTRPTVGEDIAQ